MPKTVPIPLDQIENRFDVRTKLDEDRVLQFMGMYEAGTELPPVKVVKLDTDKYAYVDGRHRGAAQAYLERTEIECIIIANPNDPAELFAQALEANWGGSKPPTREDIMHSITRMLELGATQTAIRERLQFLPAGSLKAYISSARGTIMKRKVAKALDEMGEGEHTLPEIAKKYAIPPDTLKDIVQGKKGKWGAARSTELEKANAYKTYISSQLKAANSGISKKIEQVLMLVDEGEMSYKVASDIVRAWAEHLRKTSIRVADWRARLNAVGGVNDKIPVVTEEEKGAA